MHVLNYEYAVQKGWYTFQNPKAQMATYVISSLSIKRHYHNLLTIVPQILSAGFVFAVTPERLNFFGIPSDISLLVSLRLLMNLIG